jgi:hypothetical protein
MLSPELVDKLRTTLVEGRLKTTFTLTGELT